MLRSVDIKLFNCSFNKDFTNELDSWSEKETTLAGATLVVDPFEEESREREREREREWGKEMREGRWRATNLTRLLELVGDDTTNEVRLSRVQSLHQTVQLFLYGWERVGNCFNWRMNCLKTQHSGEDIFQCLVHFACGFPIGERSAIFCTACNFNLDVWRKWR